MSARRAAVALAAAFACASCGLLGPGPAPETVDPVADDAPREHRAVESPQGTVSYDEILAGDGRPASPGDVLLVDYTVWLADEKRVDSTLDRGTPIELILGQAFVHGLDLGLAGAKPGSRRRIHVPSGLAYGPKGVETLIPADADLVIEVQVHDVRPSAH